MQDKKPFITIITPTYNRANLISHAIESIINQKQDIPFDWEMIIVDDGSTDNTKEIVENFIKKYSENIQYYSQKNFGVGKARNVGLSYMNKKSDYLFFLDSDDELTTDCIFVCLKKWQELKKKGEYDKVSQLLFYCKDQHGKTIGNKNILHGQEEIPFTYKTYLSNTISREVHNIHKSSIFLNHPEFRFPEDIVTESVLWSKMWKYFDKQGQYSLLLNYEGRIYRIECGSNQITKSINIEKFKKNAIGNERVLSIIGQDLLKMGYKKSYSEYLFRAGVNWILYGEKKKGLDYLKKSLKYNFNLKIFIIFLLSILSRKIVLFIYKIYI